jgi:c-di-GMP-binding flagellar brake protein YcgR
MLNEAPGDWDKPDRRTSSRFPITEDLSYRVYSTKNSVETGSGKTINMSSGGILFTTEKPLAAGRRMEISVNWPAQLNNRCALKLVASGRVVRAGETQAAIQIEKYEFRTRATQGLAARIATR